MRQHISSGSPLEPTIGFSRVVRDGRLVFVSATAAIWPDGHVDPDVGVQARRCLEIIDEALGESGATPRDVVRTRVFLIDASHGAAVAEVHGEAFGEIRPATGFIVVKGFLDPRWLSLAQGKQPRLCRWCAKHAPQRGGRRRQARR